MATYQQTGFFPLQEFGAHHVAVAADEIVALLRRGVHFEGDGLGNAGGGGVKGDGVAKFVDEILGLHVHFFGNWSAPGRQRGSIEKVGDKFGVGCGVPPKIITWGGKADAVGFLAGLPLDVVAIIVYHRAGFIVQKFVHGLIV